MIPRCLLTNLREDSKTLLSKQNVFSQACFPSAIRHQNCLKVWQQCCEDHKFLIEVAMICQCVCVCVCGGGGGYITICTGDGEYVSESVCVGEGRGGGGWKSKGKVGGYETGYNLQNMECFLFFPGKHFLVTFNGFFFSLSLSPPPPPPLFFFCSFLSSET